MSPKTKPIPEGYHSITPYLTVTGAQEAMRYYQKAFGAREIMRFEHEGKIGHAEMEIGDSRFMLAEEDPAWGTRSPKSLGGCSGGIAIFVEDVDKVYRQALAAGGTKDREPEDQFYGDRTACVIDPSGHKWSISTHIEDVSMDEMQRRFREFMTQMAGAPSA